MGCLLMMWICRTLFCSGGLYLLDFVFLIYSPPCGGGGTPKIELPAGMLFYELEGIEFYAKIAHSNHSEEVPERS